MSLSQGSRMQGKGVVSCKNQGQYLCCRPVFLKKKKMMSKKGSVATSVSHCSCVFYEL